MFSSRRASLSSADPGAGATLFDFLKKKKIMAVSSSRNTAPMTSSDLSFSNLQLKEDNEQTQRVHAPTIQTERKANSTNITPKKAGLTDQQQSRQTARTFIDILSPLQVRNSTNVARQTDTGTKVSAKKNSLEQNYNRRELNSSITLMCETLCRFIEVGKSLKQRSHSLFIELKPVFRLAEQIEDKQLRKKLQQAKERLRVLEGEFAELDIKNANQIIQTFQLRLSEHLISLEAKNKASHEKSQMEYIARVKAEKETKICQLSTENIQLLRKIEGLEKRVQKLTQALHQTQQEYQHRIATHQQAKESALDELRKQVQRLQQAHSETNEQLECLQRQNLEKQKILRDALYSKQSMQARLIEENANAKSAREEFLLNQIMVLKQEFQADMQQLTALYAGKERDHLRLIEDQARQLKQLKALHESNKENDKKTHSEVESLRTLAIKYRKQNECLVADMHRMNEELYQHWVALKDIRTLATRLQIMPKFAKIYEDLGYNEVMFS